MTLPHELHDRMLTQGGHRTYQQIQNLESHANRTPRVTPPQFKLEPTRDYFALVCSVAQLLVIAAAAGGVVWLGWWALTLMLGAF